MREGILVEKLQDGSYDLLLDASGKMKRGGTADQEAEFCVVSNKGEWRQFPLAGFGIDRRLKKRVGNVPFVENVTRFARDLKVELEADGHKDPEITVTADLTVFELNVEP